jgi:predicted AlkP superfamily phosphohydrolase/phosphomutase
MMSLTVRSLSLPARRRGPRLAVLAAVLAAVAAGAGAWLLRRDAPPRAVPLLVIGIDGAEWRVLRHMWRDGELPNLRRLAFRGTTATLATAYNASPVIWTTIATGVTPAEHGITDFVVPGPHGDVPITSTLRRVPALWTMLTKAHRRVSVFGWWGSWPAEDVNGVVVTDRALLFDLEARVSPQGYLPRLAEDLEWARTRPYFAPREEPELRDAVMAAAARRQVGDDPDLLLLYFRSSDIVSHRHWKEFEAVESGANPHGDSAVQRIYRAIDAAIGEVLGAARGPLNVLVLSDHGFRAARAREVRTVSNLDALLVRLGYQARDSQGVAFGRSRLYSYASPTYQRKKLVRCCLAGREPGGTLSPGQCAAARARFEADLRSVTFAGGEPAFIVRDARPRDERAGADFVALLSSVGTSTTVLVGGKPAKDVVTDVSELSGTHDSNTDGILIAAGPDVAAGANLEGISVLDVAPTVLYGLGLPVAENFAGRAWTELYRPEFRRRHPLRTIRSWGAPRGSEARKSGADDKLIQELRSLGYLR